MKVAIFGSGGLAKELLGYLACDARYEVVCVVSTEQFNNPDYATYRVLAEAPNEPLGYFLAVSDPEAKRLIVAKNEDRWVNYIHPTCTISPYARIGRGCVFAPQSIVAGDAVIDDFVFFNTNAAVGHDSRIRSYTTLFPNTEVCGGCDIGEGVIFGIGSYAFPNVNVVAGAKVSAGAIVRKSVLEAVTVYGDPARAKC